MNDPVFPLIRQFEGFRETPYWDVNAFRTGYGSDTITTADGKVVPVRQDMTVTREDAERDLQRRVQTEFMPRAVSAVGQEAWGRLNPHQRAALTSITYNYGSLPQSVAAAVRSGDPQAVAAAIRGLGGHNDGINLERREAEAAVFLGGPLPEGSAPAIEQAPQNVFAMADGRAPQRSALRLDNFQLDAADFMRPTRNSLGYT